MASPANWQPSSVNILRRVGRAFDPAVVQRLAPESVEIGAGVLFLPVLLNQIVSGETRLAGENRDDFVRGLAAIQRLDQRLNDAHCAVIGAGIAPRFEIVRFGNVPLAKFGGLVAMRTETNLQADGIRFQRGSKFEFGRRVISRIAAENQQQVNLARAHVIDERLERLAAIDGIGIDGLGVKDRLANIAQLCFMSCASA